MEEDTNNLHPIEVLIEELKCEDLGRRVLSVRTINTIAIALGPKQTREELLPYLLELMDDENEVLLALAESLRNLIYSIGGKKYSYTLFDLLEQLLQIDESLIRSATLDSFKQILKYSNSSHFSKAVLDLIKRLCGSEKVPAKIAATYLIPSALEIITEKKQYIDQFKLLMLCSHPQVRIAASENIKLLIKHQEFIAELLNIATVDQEDTVRLLAVDALLSCNNVKGLVTSITALFEDDYWKVKQKLAQHLFLIPKFIENKPELLLEYFRKIVNDKEIEVRTAVCQNISQLMKNIPKNYVNKYIAEINSLGNDIPQIKTAVALEINKIWEVSPKNEDLVTLINSLTSTYSAQISLNLLQSIRGLKENYQGFEIFIKNQFSMLSKDRSWRIRQCFLSQFGYMAEQLGTSFFNDNLKDLLMNFITDSAFSVRETAAKVLEEVVSIFGNEWLEKSLLEKLINLQYSKNYITRMAYLACLRLIFRPFLNSKVGERLEKSVFYLLGDPVCNVRAYALKAVLEIYKSAPFEKQQVIKNSLLILNQDEDLEIRSMLCQFC